MVKIIQSTCKINKNHWQKSSSIKQIEQNRYLYLQTLQIQDYIIANAYISRSAEHQNT